MRHVGAVMGVPRSVQVPLLGVAIGSLMLIAASAAFGIRDIPLADAHVTSPTTNQQFMCPNGQTQATFTAQSTHTFGIQMAGPHDYIAGWTQRLETGPNPGGAQVGTSDPDEIGYWSVTKTLSHSWTAGIGSHVLTAETHIQITDTNPTKSATAYYDCPLTVVPYG